MIENRQSRTALLCVDLRDGQLWLRSPQNTSPISEVQLVSFRSISKVRGRSLDCVISTPAARGDARYGEAIELMSPSLVMAGQRR